MRQALRERRERLGSSRVEAERPSAACGVAGNGDLAADPGGDDGRPPLTKEEVEEILGYGPEGRLILDSSAVVSVLASEQGHERVCRRRWRRADLLAIGAPTLVEAGMVVAGRSELHGRALVAQFLEPGNVVVSPVRASPLAGRRRRLLALRQGPPPGRAQLRRLHDLRHRPGRRHAAAVRRRRLRQDRPDAGAALRPRQARALSLAGRSVVVGRGVGLDRVGPAQLLRRLAHPDDPGRDCRRRRRWRGRPWSPPSWCRRSSCRRR